ncbi:MAG: SusC/RagA family protein [Bacteroidales bacterium 36-12]|nr:MAG: SusC/RagA family protein [Bacteroidales bacterium 36-12]
MKKILSIIAVILFCSSAIFAQQKTVKGVITDENGEPLMGVSIVVKNTSNGTITNLNGEYSIRVDSYDVLVVKYLGYKQVEIPVIKNVFDLQLEEDSEKLQEVIVVGAGQHQKKATLSGAITTVEVGRLRVSSANMSNALVGNVVGIIGHQTTGEPGENTTEFWVRGISTFGANAKALVLVDGIERSLDQLNYEDIESFSVLKDASATAIYGSRGANGVIMITTRRGAAGKVNINVKQEYGYNTRSRTPQYTDAFTYASMANEAKATRYQAPLYSSQDLEIIERDLDADLFPNINWQDVILKPGASNYRTTVSVNGGGASARYYVSGSYYNEGGIYKTEKETTNVSYERYNYRMNTDVDITKTTLLRVGVSGYLVNQTKPRPSSDEIWESLSNLTPLTVPRMYSNGLIPTYGTGGTMNPEVQLNKTGHKRVWQNKAETNITLEQDLKFITKGLRFIGTFSFDSENNSTVTRTKQPELWNAGRIRDRNGNLVMTRVSQETPFRLDSGEPDGRYRYYTEAKLDYSRKFGDDHTVTGLLMYYQQERQRIFKYDTTNAKVAIPFRNIGLSGRVTYGFRDKYLLDMNFGYNGSENFEPGKQFGFFPALSAGWVISEEKFIKENVWWLNMFKIRYSYGLVGEDKLTSDEKDYSKRIAYTYLIEGSDGYTFGEFNTNKIGGYRITGFGSPGLTWEKAIKNNLGIDFVFLNNKISFTTDIFKDHRKDIFMQRGNMPFSTGLQDKISDTWANIGEMESYGIEGVASYSDKIGEVNYTLRGNFTFATTNVIEHDEADNALYYQMTRGYRLNQTRGLISLGLFENEQDIANSPKQTFGAYLPGDIKYKDVNGDGVIDNKDVVPIGHTTVPSFVYGAGLSLQWRSFDFNMLLQGAGMVDFYIGGNSIYLFSGETVGNILEKMTDPKDRWIENVNENPNAVIPRLSYGANANNFQRSTYWLRDGRYLRLKNLEFGYSFPKRWVNAVHATNMRLGFIGTNLLVFSPFDWWDPEIGNRSGAYYKDGAKYPISRNFSFNFTINF